MLPDFLQETEEQVHKRMIEMAPPDYDTSEGSLYWDHTAPTAMVRSRLVEYELTLTLMMMFPQFASGPFLDYHGEPLGVYRRAATQAVGFVTFEGKPETLIPIGTLVSTIGDEEEAGLLFEVTSSAIIGESGSVTVRVRSLEAGVIGNVPVGSIQSLVKSLPGVTTITNSDPIKDGAAEESDDSLRERIVDQTRNKPLSGSKGDYIKWAKEVAGVGNVIVLPLWNGPQTVKVLITNSEGAIASPELIAAVQNHIAPDNDLGGGLAPIGALVTVDTISTVPIDITMKLEIKEGHELQFVISKVKENLNSYFSNISLIKWAEVVAVIINTVGVSDCGDLLINEEIYNIVLNEGERAVAGEVILL